MWYPSFSDNYGSFLGSLLGTGASFRSEQNRFPEIRFSESIVNVGIKCWDDPLRILNFSRDKTVCLPQYNGQDKEPNCTIFGVA